MESRYINASDVSKVLGKDYGFYWAKQHEILDIIFNLREKYVPSELNFELNNNTQHLIENLPKQELSDMVVLFKTKEEILTE